MIKVLIVLDENVPVHTAVKEAEKQAKKMLLRLLEWQYHGKTLSLYFSDSLEYIESYAIILDGIIGVDKETETKVLVHEF